MSDCTCCYENGHAAYCPEGKIEALILDNAQLRTAIRYVFRLGLPSEQRALLMRAMSTRHVGGTIIDVDPMTGEEVGDHE